MCTHNIVILILLCYSNKFFFCTGICCFISFCVLCDIFLSVDTSYNIFSGCVCNLFSFFWLLRSIMTMSLNSNYLDLAEGYLFQFTWFRCVYLYVRWRISYPIQNRCFSIFLFFCRYSTFHNAVKTFDLSDLSNLIHSNNIYWNCYLV